MKLTLQFLGTGTSVGVPQIGCSCPACTSADPRDRRRRTGAYVRCGDTAFLVDTPPELREACLAFGIRKVDAVVFTHCHMDHVAGFDDVRRFNTLNGRVVPCGPRAPGENGRAVRVVGKPLRCYGAPETLASLRAVFPYVTDRADARGLFRPQILFTPVERAFRVGNVRVTPLPVEHGPRTNGYLFDGALAYVSDCRDIPAATLRKMRGVDTLVLDCLRVRPHPTHLHLDAALALVEAIAPRVTYFVHVCHDLPHAEFERLLPRGVHLAYDGLVVSPRKGGACARAR